MEAKLILVLCALLACATASPVMISSFSGSDSCARTCDTPSKFRYQPGTTYVYDYEIQAQTAMTDASQETATVAISGQANIEVIDQCDFVLAMKNVRATESSPLQDGTSDMGGQLSSLLESRPLRFAFQDGVISEVCPDSEESPAALNIKRGLLSALQNSMDRLQGTQTVQESDITGTCATTYEATGSTWGRKTTIRRRKDLTSCTDRHSYAGSLQTIKYQMPSEMQAAPLMNSTHECEQEISKHIIASSTCRETHLFRPFSSQSSGAMTTVSQKLVFKTSQSGVSSRKDSVTSRGPLTFDHGFGMEDSSEARASAEALLTTLCDVTSNGIRPEVPRMFSQLVEAVKKMDRADLRELYDQIQRGQICGTNGDRTKKFLLDALPMSSSSEAVAVMKDLMLTGAVQGLDVDLWLTALAFIPSPSEDMLNSVKELLQSEVLRVKSMLAVTAMVNNFCSKSDSCDVQAVRDIMKTLDSIIGSRCAINDGNLKTVLSTLSAIGNTGQSMGIDTLKRCLGDRLPNEVRVAAVQAFRRMPCDADKTQLQIIMENKNEDAEIRNTAYLQLMTCPTPALLTQIQIVLEAEAEESQVGSFVYSHLENLKETSNPLKQGIKEMVRDLQLKKLFDLNPLKASRNYEKSAFLKAMKLGGSVESNVLFSSRSPLPRSVTANLTVEVLGHSLNLLEVGGRLEGLEYLLENLQNKFLSDASKASRSSKAKLDDLKGSGFARIFGNELAYGRFQGLSFLTSGNTFNIMDFLIKLSKEQDYSFTQSLKLFDISMTVPTIGGLPLTLSVNGTAVVDLQAQGKMDLRKMSQSPRSVLIDGQIRPSGAVSVDSLMSVDALVTGTGLKMTSSLHSSTGLKGHVELERGNVLTVEIDMPDDKIEIFDVRSKFFVVHNGRESEQKMITANRKEFELCTGNMMAAASGLELCGQLQFPNASTENTGPYFPLTGPSSFSLVLHKRDSHTGYKLLAKRVETKKSSTIQLLFDTPGSSTMRAVSFDMDINYPQHLLSASFASPWWKTSARGSYMNEDEMKSISGEVVINDDQKYSVTSELKIDEQGESKVTVITPLLEIKVPGRDAISLTGNVRVDKTAMYSTDLALSGLTAQPVQLQASLTNTKSDKRVAGSLTFIDQTYKTEAGVKYNVRPGKSAQFTPLAVVSSPSGDIVKLEGDINYMAGKTLNADLTLNAPMFLAIPVSFNSNLVKKITKGDAKYDVDVRLKSRPFTGKVDGFVKVGDSTVTKVTLEYSAKRLGKETVTINGKFSNRSTEALTKYTLSGNVDFKTNSDFNVNLNTLDFEHKKKHTSGSLELAIGKNPKNKANQISLSGTVSPKVKDVANMDIDIKGKAYIPMLGLDADLDGSHAHSPDSLVSKMTLNYAKDKAVVASVNLKNKGSEGKMRMTGDALLNYPGQRYGLSTSLAQSSKQYVHTMQVTSQDDSLLDVKSSYKPAKDQTHEVTSSIVIADYRPINVSGMVGLEKDNLQLQGQLLLQDDKYTLAAQSKVSKGPRGKWTLDWTQPSRAVAFSAMGGLQGSSVEMDVDLAWDKGRDENAKISASMSGGLKSSTDTQSLVAKADLKTPFPALRGLSAGISLDNDRQRYGMDGKLTFNDDSFTSKLEARKPLLPSNVQVTFSAGTPMREMERLEASIDHTITPRALRTLFTTTRNGYQTSVSILANDNGQTTISDVSADITLKSDETDAVRDVAISMAHKCDGRKYESRASFSNDGQRYSAELSMTHYWKGWTVQNVGQVKIASPLRNIVTNWQHRNTENDIKTTLTSNLAKGKDLRVEITGDKKVSRGTTAINGALAIRSPWQLPKDLSLTLKHDYSEGRLTHSCALNVNGQKTMATDANYLLASGDLRGDFSLSIPQLMEDKSGKVQATYSRYPVSGSLEFKTSPSTVYSADASFVSRGDLDMEANARFNTPCPVYPTIVVSGSVKQEEDDVITKANLDLGVRQIYDMEVRLRPNELTMARVKIGTPLPQMTSLDTGYLMTGTWDDGEVTADLSLEPTLGKYSGLANYRRDEDGLSGKLRVDTPIRAFRYGQITFSSQPEGIGRKSLVEAQYYPRETYTLTSFYTTSMPLTLTVQAQTPIRGYESFGLSLKHQHDDNLINTQGQLQYLPNKVIDSTLIINLQPKIDAALVIKTPFDNFKESKVSVRHDGDLNDFNTHAEVELMQEKTVTDVVFKTGLSSMGKITFSTTVGDVLPMEASFTKRGPLDNIRGSATLSYGKDKIIGNLQHKQSDSSVKSFASLKTPYTEDADISVEVTKLGGTYQHTMTAKYADSYKFDSSASLALTGTDVDLRTDLKYQLAAPQQVISLSLNKKGDFKNLDLGATITSPFTEAAALTLRHQARLPTSLQTTLNGNYGDFKISSENKFSAVRSDVSASSVNVANIEGEKHEVSMNVAKKGDAKSWDLSADATYNEQKLSASYKMAGAITMDMEATATASLNSDAASVTFSKKGDISDLDISASGSLNDQKISVTGDLKMTDSFEGNVEIKTPFTDFESMSVAVVHTPKTGLGFTQKGSLNYKTGKTISYNVDVAIDGLKTMSLDADLTTPFTYLEQTTVKLNHIVNRSSKLCSGSAEVRCYLGSHKVSYTSQGDISHMVLDASVESDGKKMSSHVERLPLTNGYRHTVDLSVPSGKQYTSAVETEMTQDSLRGKMQAAFGSQLNIALEADASVTGNSAQLNARTSMTTGRQTSTSNVSLKKTGPLDDITLEIKGALNAQQGSAVAQFKRLSGQISGQVDINTPFSGFKNIGASFLHSGNTDRFNSEASLKYMDDKAVSAKANFYRYQMSRIEATAEITTPFAALSQAKADYRHTSTSDQFNCAASLSSNNDERNKYSLELSGSKSPKYEGSLTIVTPISSWRRLQAQGSLDTSVHNKVLTSSLVIPVLGRYTLEGSLDAQAIPATFTTQLTTPHAVLPRLSLSASHQGDLTDFSSGFVFATSKTDTIKGDVSFKYNGPYDVSGSAALTSAISGLEDLKAEVKNTELAGSKSSHVMARWAPGQQVTVDGSYTRKDYWSNKQILTDLAIATPFQLLKSAAVHIQHDQADAKHKPKVTVTYNGQLLVDVEGETTLGDSPAFSATSRQPWPAQLSGSLTNSGDLVEGDVYVNWNRDMSDQNLRFKVKTKGAGSDIDYSIKVIHPSRTVSSGFTLSQSSTKMSSEGFLSWDDASNSRAFYTIALGDNSQYSRKVYEGTVKMGIPARTLQTSGSYSENRGVSAVDASFSWDADRDVSKQVGFSTKYSSGQTACKADVTFRLPGKEVRIDHEHKHGGSTVFDGKTALSYSRDARKTLSFSSLIKDVSSSGQNYSVSLAIKHPITDTDISLTSHFGATADRYSAALDTIYLSSRRQQKNLALRGEIDRLKKLIDLQLVSPLKKMSMHGQMDSSEPYVIRLTNTYDESDVITSQLSLDSSKRNVIFTTNYDLSQPERQLVLSAGYSNTTYMKAELMRQLQDGSALATDSLLSLRLVEPSLLKASVAWRPDLVDDLQAYVQAKTLNYASAIRQTLNDATLATGQEVSAKYASFAREFTTELSPFLEVVQAELDTLGSQVQTSYLTLATMYRNNDFYLQNLGDGVMDVIMQIRKYNDAYMAGYRSVINSMRSQLDTIGNYNIRQAYDQALSQLADNIAMGLAQNADWLNHVIDNLNQQVALAKGQVDSAWLGIQNHPQVQRVQMLGSDFRWLMSHMSQRVQQFSIPEQYVGPIYNARDVLSGGLYTVLNNTQVKRVQGAANEVYQQGMWAYKYWQVEENARQSLTMLGQLVADLIKAEFQDLADKVQAFRKAKVVVYDPEQGYIEIDIALPIPLKSLQELPDFQSYLSSAQKTVDQYFPDKDTVVEVYNKYSPWFNKNKTSTTTANTIATTVPPPTDQLMIELQNYQPSRPQKGRGTPRAPYRVRPQ